MQKMTTAYANRMLKSLEEDKTFWVNKEETSSTYVVANNEEPVNLLKQEFREPLIMNWLELGNCTNPVTEII